MQPGVIITCTKGFFHLKEDSRVLLVNRNQLHVSNGVNNTHRQPGHSHCDGQREDIIAQRDDGKYYGDDKSRDK